MEYSDLVLHTCQLAQTALRHYQHDETQNSAHTLAILRHMLGRHILPLHTPLTKQERNYGNEQPKPE